MSVILFDPQELADLYRAYESVNPRRGSAGDGPEPQEVALALQACHYANVMAWCLTYQRDNDDPPEMYNLGVYITTTPMKLHFNKGVEKLQRDIVRQFYHIQYNCVSNTGTQCIPQKYYETLEWAIRSLVNKLARIYED